MPQYCLVKHRISTYVIDGDDADHNPDRVPVTGGVTFTPILNKGDSVVVTENGIATTITLTPIEARITNGEIYHRGEEGVKLFAGGPDTNPERIRYRATFHNLIADGKKVELKNILFEAAPGGELSLAVAQPVPGAPYPGYSSTIEAGIAEIGLVRDGAIDFAVMKINEARDEVLGEVGDAIQDAKEANVLPRVTALEAMNGVSPESPVDGQTANLLTQPDTLTRAALGALTIGSTTTPEQETATLGPELVTSTGWSLGEGWSGNSADGFTKTPGATEPLVWTPPFSTGTTLYLVEWTWDGTSTHQDVYAGFDVYFGGAYAGITYQGGTNMVYSRAIRSLADGTLEFRPWDTFEGRIHSISVREVAGTSALPPTVWRDSDNNRSAEMRFTHGTNHSVFIGLDSGKYNISGYRNVAVGAYSMANNVSGFINSAFGFNALNQLTSGTRNAAFGYQALASTTSGDRNVGVGPFALTRNTTGQRNIAIGVDVLWRAENGDDNIGMGYLTMTELGANGDKTQGNIAIGRYAMRQSKTGNRNIAIGEAAAHNVQGDGAIAIGTRAMWSNLGAESIAVGNHALENLNANSDREGQTAIGTRALRRGYSSSQFNRNTAVGFESGENLLRGRNTAVGHQALKGDPAVEITGNQGSRNTAIGALAGLSVTTGEMNTFIGSNAGTSVTTGSNNVIIGVATGTPTMSDTLNIGNVLWGDLATKRFSVDVQNPTARMHLPAGGTEPGSAPLKLSSSADLLDAPEPGSFEFRAGILYFTPSTGVRREIAFVTTPEPEPEP